MKLIFRYMNRYKWAIFFGMFLKFSATLCELMLPRILEHLVDKVVPRGEIREVFLWGILMVVTAIVAWLFNINANALSNNNNKVLLACALCFFHSFNDVFFNIKLNLGNKN